MTTLAPISGSPKSGSRPPAAWLWKLTLAFALTAYFLYFNWAGLRVHFALDDLGNIGHYYNYSPVQLVLSNFLPWRGDSRPLGGLFYIPIYHFAGLNPLPYQAVLLLVLLANVYWAYRFARLLGAGELAAALLALVCCYHGGIANLYYNAAFVFDALCCFFYLAAFVYYLRIRNRGQLLSTGQTVAFLALFLCALNAKEMAVSVPVMLLVYEWFYHAPARWNRPELLAWLHGPARVALIAAALNLVDIYGKLSGPNAMSNAEGYRPVFTLDRILAFHVAALQDLFFSYAWIPGWGQILALWAVLAWLAWRRTDRPVLRFLFWFLLVVPLPIEFLPGKREACFVLLLVGGALFLAVVFMDAVERGVAFLAHEFTLPPAGRPILLSAVLVATVSLWAREQNHLRQDVGKAPMTTLGFETSDLIEQLRASSFHPRPGSSVAFVDDPFRSLEMYNLAQLWLHDRSVALHTVCQGPLTPQELAKVDALFTFENRKLVRLK